MPIYRVSHKIWTVADIDGTPVIEGFQMTAVPPEAVGGPQAWLARHDVDAPDFLSAYNMSRPGLVRTVDALSLVTQCAFSLVATSFSVVRLTDNADRIIYFRHLRQRPTVGIGVWRPEQLADIATLSRMENPGALRYFREAINASTSSARLAMLVITAEALAGQSTVVGNSNCGHEYRYGGTNREELAAVLGAESYERLLLSPSIKTRARLEIRFR